MAYKWISTKFPGIRYRVHPTRKYANKPDKYFAIRYQAEGKRKEEGLGWSSEKWTAEKAALALAELKKAHTTGEGPTRLTEKREIERLRKESDAAGKKVAASQQRVDESQQRVAASQLRVAAAQKEEAEALAANQRVIEQRAQLQAQKIAREKEMAALQAEAQELARQRRDAENLLKSLELEQATGMNNALTMMKDFTISKDKNPNNKSNHNNNNNNTSTYTGAKTGYKK